MDDRILLSVRELCEYTGLGKTKIREILNRPNSKFTVRVGNRLYANKKIFDEYINNCTKYGIEI